jgi:hypothetical protein
MAHKFRVGQQVLFTAEPTHRHIVPETCVIVRQLPERDGEFQYGIRNTHEPHERAAKQSQLRDI